MDKAKKEVFTVVSSNESWLFLNGYSCYSVDKDSFIRHLSYKFGDFCIFHDIKDAVERNDIRILTASDFEEITVRNVFNISKTNKEVKLFAGYDSDFGYVLEFYLIGSTANEFGTNTHCIVFANKKEALDWWSDTGL